MSRRTRFRAEAVALKRAAFAEYLGPEEEDEDDQPDGEGDTPDIHQSQEQTECPIRTSR